MHIRVLLIAVALAGAALAQSDLATIRGTALDQSGAVAPKVRIELINVETNTSREMFTNADGDFEIP
jgi:hypothetical protein